MSIQSNTMLAADSSESATRSTVSEPLVVSLAVVDAHAQVREAVMQTLLPFFASADPVNQGNDDAPDAVSLWAEWIANDAANELISKGLVH